MATTSKKSPSKKTKTTRKVSASTTKKTISKSTKKPTKSVIAAKPTKKLSKSIIETPLQKLQSLNYFVAFASAFQAALVLLMSKSTGGIHSVTTSFPTSDSLATAGSGRLQTVTGTHLLFDIHLF